MKSHLLVGTLLAVLAFMTVTLIPSNPVVHAAGTPTVGVWDPVRHTNNITDAGLVTGFAFTLDVNITNGGPIAGFDITILYEMTPYFAVPIHTSQTDISVSGGLFDGSVCGVTPIVNSVYPTEHYIREAYVTNGCSIVGNGVLFSITFTVDSTGTTSFSIPQASAGGLSQLVVPYPPSSQRIPGLQAVGGTFENLRGLPTPPVAKLDYTPGNPFVGTLIAFNATNSFDPGHATETSHGITQVIWTFGDTSSPVKGSMPAVGVTHHQFLLGPTIPASGYYAAILIVVNSANVPNRADALVFLDPGRNHDLAVSIVAGVTSARVGDTVQITVTVANRGNQNDTASLTTWYQYQGNKTVGQEPSISMPVGTPIKQFRYSLDTSNLIPEVYTVTTQVQLLGTNATDPTPNDNVAQVSFTLLGLTTTSNTGFLSTPVLAVSGVVALAAILGGVQLLRRRRRLAEEKGDKLA